MQPTSRRRSRAMIRSLLASLTAGLILAGAALASTPLSARAADGAALTWGVRTGENEQGSGRQNFDYAIDPGEELADTIVVTNYDPVPIELDVYPADGYTTEAGQLDLLTREETSNGVGAWIELEAEHVQVPAGASVEIPFTVDVPANAEPGDYAGGIVSSLPVPEEDQGISVERRLGIRVHLRVGGELAPRLEIEGMTVDYAGTANPFGPGEATVSYTVRNAGNARFSADQAVSVSGPFGWFAVDATDAEPVPQLLPGETWEVSVSVAGVLPAFLLTAQTSLDPVFPESAGSAASLAAVEASATTWAIPWLLLALVLVLAALVVGILLFRRASRRRRARLEDARVAEAVEQALREREESASHV